MREQLSSLSKLFTEHLFRIPDFQRGYAWTKKEIEDFWQDLLRLKPQHNHYVGVLTLEKVKEPKYSTWLEDNWMISSRGYTPFYVVDGQQRLTTSIVLLSAIVDTMVNKNIEKLNQYKDFTDTFYALKYAYELSDDVTIFGGILGKRVEHLIANLNMFNLYPNLKIIDDNSMIFVKDKTFEIVNSIYKYASFFSIEEVKDLSLEGFKYKLNNYDLKPFDSLCISNEITNNATVKFSDGKLLCILSHQD